MGGAQVWSKMDCCTLTLWFTGVFAVLLIYSFFLSMRKKYSLNGKHVLITGGSSGIGKCVAQEVLKRGASQISLVARNKEKLLAVKEELESKHKLNSAQVIKIISADVGKADVASKIKQALSGTKPVDVLINSAGITYTNDFLQTGRDMFESLMKTNVLGTVELVRAVLPSMIDRQEGRIVLVCSQAGQFPMYGYSAYASTKYALRGFAEVLQMEVKPYNIKIIVSYPPDTETPQLEEEIKHRSPMVAELSSYGTTLKPDQIASEILDGVERSQFSVSHGFDGFMLKTATVGAAPFTFLFELFTQFFLTGIFRLVSLWYLRQFNSIVRRTLKKEK